MCNVGANSLNPQGGDGKDKKYIDQLSMVFKAFKIKPMTMLEADKHTGIMRSNICWYVRDLLKANKIAVVEQRKCSISGFPKVNVYSGDERLLPKSNQLSIF